MSIDEELGAGLLSAMQHSGEPMVLADPHQPDMPIIAVNAAFETLSGYDRSEIVGHNCRFLQGQETDLSTVRKMRSSLDEGKGCIQWLVNYRKNGTMFWNLLFISPVFAADGRLLYFFANQHDLSGGSPLALETFPLGPAHMPLDARHEFHDVLARLGQAASAPPADGARSLEATLAGARQVAYLSTRLVAGSGT